MSHSPPWLFDEFKHIGVDFADPQQVQTYDDRQGTQLAGERQLVARLNIGEGDHVIEFGPGTGAFTLAAAEAGAHVIGVDISQAMLDYGQSKAAAMGLTNSSFVQSGFLSYQHEGNPVDFVVTKFAFHHLSDFWKAVALHRINQLLKMGGTFYLCDVVFSFKTEEYEHHLNQWIDEVAGDGGNGFSRRDFEMHIRDEYSPFAWILEVC